SNARCRSLSRVCSRKERCPGALGVRFFCRSKRTQNASHRMGSLDSMHLPERPCVTTRQELDQKLARPACGHPLHHVEKPPDCRHRARLLSESEMTGHSSPFECIGEGPSMTSRKSKTYRNRLRSHSLLEPTTEEP